MALPDERCAEGRDGMQLSEIRQVLVEDWEIDIKQMIRRGRNAAIKCTVEIDNRIDAVAIHNPPVGDCRRDEKKSRVVHLKQFHSITRFWFLNPTRQQSTDLVSRIVRSSYSRHNAFANRGREVAICQVLRTGLSITEKLALRVANLVTEKQTHGSLAEPHSYAVLIWAAFCSPSSSTKTSRMQNFWIFPVTVIGKSLTIFMCFGILKLAIFPLQNLLISSGVVVASAFSFTNAQFLPQTSHREFQRPGFH